MHKKDFRKEGEELDNTAAGCPVYGRGFPELMTEEELIRFLRIPDVSKTGNHHNVVANLRRMHGLPCVHISKQPLYPVNAVRKWIEEKRFREQQR